MAGERMLFLSDLRDHRVRFGWPEVVAIVLELAQIAGDEGPIAELEHVSLMPDGRLLAWPGSVPPDNPVCRLAQALEAFLDPAGAPAELIQLAKDNTGSPPRHTSVASFTRALSFFERPGRGTLIESAAAAASSALPLDFAHGEPEREPPARASVAPRGATRRKMPWRMAAAFAALTVLAALGVLALRAGWLREAVETGSARLAVLLAPAEERDQATPAGEASAAPSVAERSPSRGTRPGATAAKTTPTDVRLQAANQSPEAARPPLLATIAGPAGSIGAIAGAGIALLPGFGTDLGLPTADEYVYSSADSDVAPARLLRPQLPAKPPSNVPASQIGVLHLLVGKTGTVEEVRLVSPANRFQERMLVAAAKAWHFQPARKDGQPVRYRIHLSITL